MPEKTVNNDELDRCLGQILRSWHGLEGALLFFAMTLMRTSDQPRIQCVMESFPNLRARKNFVLNLGESFLELDVLPRFRSLLRRFGDLSAVRNGYVHSIIGTDPDRESHVFLMRSSLGASGLEFRTLKFPRNELRSHREAVSELSKEMLQFLDVMQHRVHTLHRTHRELPS